MNIEEFVKQNIVKINDVINEYKTGHDFSDIEIKNHLHSKLKQDILITKHIELLFDEINNVRHIFDGKCSITIKKTDPSKISM